MNKMSNSFLLCLLLFFSSPLFAQQSFKESRVPIAPEYSSPSAWASLPMVPGAAKAYPSNLPSDKSVKSDVDVFYIHPTTLKRSDIWNQDLSDTETNQWTDASVIARQASVFNACCKISAPRYRQASFAAGGDITLQGDGGMAYKLAYSDILRAFDYFLANINKGRPFIIAGHSQGGLMTYWLLRDRIDRKELQNKLIAAYIIGIDLMEGDFGRTYTSLTLCKTPLETGCILAWNAVKPETDINLMMQYAGSRYSAIYHTSDGRKGVCINPITFDANQPHAAKVLSKGAVPGNPGYGELRAVIPNAVSATCEQGYLKVTFDSKLELVPGRGGSLHYHEFGLFYADIRANIAKRIESYMH